jgi:hypothetical protein
MSRGAPLEQTAKLVAALALSALTTACGKPWQVVTQAQPSPMVDVRQYSVQPIVMDGLIVGEKPEQAWLADRDAEQRAAWVEDKKELDSGFRIKLVEAMQEHGMQIVPQGPFQLWPRIEYVEPGFYAAIAASASETRMRLRITTAAGQVVDEITVKSSTGGSLTCPSISCRLSTDAENLAEYVAEYIAIRAGLEEE